MNFWVSSSTHSKEHEGTRAPGKSNEVAITAKEKSTQNSEDHSEKKNNHTLNLFV